MTYPPRRVGRPPSAARTFAEGTQHFTADDYRYHGLRAIMLALRNRRLMTEIRQSQAKKYLVTVAGREVES